MDGEKLDRWTAVLLGREPHQRRAMRNTLLASMVYVVCCVMQWVWATTGHGITALGLSAIVLTCSVQAAFVVAIRSGWSRRFADPTLSLPQTLCAILGLGAAYLNHPEVRGALLMVAVLVVAFGAFSLTPRRCRQLGWFSLLVLGTAMAIGAFTQPQHFEPLVEGITFVFTAATLPLMGHLSGQLSQMRRDLRAQRRELSDALQRVNLLAIRDELTGLPNRRHMRERAEHEVQRVRRSAGTLCIGVLDLDHFKTVNDQLGHSAGDAVLMNFALQAQSVLRETDLLARWGGEEFLLLCPDTTIDQALQVIERLRLHLHRPESWSATPVERVTFSAGLADHDPKANFEQTLGLADAALYKAKSMGRDRCIVA